MLRLVLLKCRQRISVLINSVTIGRVKGEGAMLCQQPVGCVRHHGVFACAHFTRRRGEVIVLTVNAIEAKGHCGSALVVIGLAVLLDKLGIALLRLVLLKCRQRISCFINSVAIDRVKGEGPVFRQQSV